jgi:hypothetical protein
VSPSRALHHGKAALRPPPEAARGVLSSWCHGVSEGIDPGVRPVGSRGHGPARRRCPSPHWASRDRDRRVPRPARPEPPGKFGARHCPGAEGAHTARARARNTPSSSSRPVAGEGLEGPGRPPALGLAGAEMQCVLYGPSARAVIRIADALPQPRRHSHGADAKPSPVAKGRGETPSLIYQKGQTKPFITVKSKGGYCSFILSTAKIIVLMVLIIFS